MALHLNLFHEEILEQRQRKQDTLKIGSRFYWGSFLDRVARCVAPNSQLTSIEGSMEESKGVSVSIEGVAAGREPRSAAEDLRQLLIEQLAKSYTDVKVEFKALEDL